ncbi:hypothetical protein GCM10011430_04290 [Oxalicibacterium solurbis]|uniref:Uncharacterized protein n=1 Tax=Oxalicibacterium solurbis TaxID=69280 RepID=A0A8J3AU51_9BURK|nr:hypothetical protein GCM10011430_04290 [Oxalicibacterium solurbis]
MTGRHEACASAIWDVNEWGITFTPIRIETAAGKRQKYDASRWRNLKQNIRKWQETENR